MQKRSQKLSSLELWCLCDDYLLRRCTEARIFARFICDILLNRSVISSSDNVDRQVLLVARVRATNADYVHIQATCTREWKNADKVYRLQ